MAADVLFFVNTPSLFLLQVRFSRMNQLPIFPSAAGASGPVDDFVSTVRFRVSCLVWFRL
jgi:hypothetical protein